MPRPFEPIFSPKSIGSLLKGYRWLIDEDVSPVAAARLTMVGHDAVAVCGNRNLAGRSDSYLFDLARDESRILVTEDKGYGKLVFIDKVPAPAGLVFIRNKRSRSNVADLLVWLIGDQPLLGRYVTVSGGRGRNQTMPIDRERARLLEEIGSHRPYVTKPVVLPFVLPEHLVAA
jgi:predicted nuclease of predicted toxin-antitoxin system